MSPNDQDQNLAKRRHDLSNAVRVLRYALESIQEGYKFDDDKAQAKIASLDRAISCLEREMPELEKLLR